MKDIQARAQDVLKSVIRSVPNFPKEGINFIDILPLFSLQVQDEFTKGSKIPASRVVLDFMQDRYHGKIDAVAGIDARGFILGAALADRMSMPFLALRKTGKLPPPVHEHRYASEYAEDGLALGKGSSSSFQNVLVVDDVLATGGTAGAAAALLRADNARVHSFFFLLELSFLGGRRSLGSAEIFSLLELTE